MTSSDWCSPVYCQDWFSLQLRLYLSTRERPEIWPQLSEHAIHRTLSADSRRRRAAYVLLTRPLWPEGIRCRERRGRLGICEARLGKGLAVGSRSVHVDIVAMLMHCHDSRIRGSSVSGNYFDQSFNNQDWEAAHQQYLDRAKKGQR